MLRVKGHRSADDFTAFDHQDRPKVAYKLVREALQLSLMVEES